ncbi:hypothetical protein QPL79_01130 [Ignisphaera sp. 4213-co]|uniref:Uncharacterized protein n=1 Tax=Ignisphaera cupida TaxID=3050454 RepID=A0ABD4Z4B4_9CREN|nr:hypothetical protein [Ignisphaera sp. 4213-co]MDK6027969.1 hypothetical protein [Ignisphaera sp. 4213-co]
MKGCIENELAKRIVIFNVLAIATLLMLLFEGSLFPIIVYLMPLLILVLAIILVMIRKCSLSSF